MSLFAPGLPYRIPLYIVLGITTEFFFTALTDLINPNFLKSWNVFSSFSSTQPPTWKEKRDPRAVGYSFLWMVPIYVFLIFLEPLSPFMTRWPFYLRGVLYALGLWAVEYGTGWIIKKISGRCPWDYNLASTHIHGFIRLDFFPFWFAFMLFAEWMSGKFVALSPALMQVFGG